MKFFALLPLLFASVATGNPPSSMTVVSAPAGAISASSYGTFTRYVSAVKTSNETQVFEWEEFEWEEIRRV